MIEKLVDKFEIVEMKDNSVYRTKLAESRVWISIDIPCYKIITDKDGKKYQYVTLSSAALAEVNHKTIRNR